MSFRKRATLKELIPTEKGGNKTCHRDMPQGYKTFFMLNSIEHEIYLAHKC